MASVEGRGQSDRARLLRDRTIRDFGEQWSWDPGNEGFYGSQELFQDILGPLLRTEDLRGLRVADVGSGTGRIARMLLDAGAAHVIAVEPSGGVGALAANLQDAGERVEIVHQTGEALPAGRDLDLVISIGVIQFVPDPLPVLRAAHRALRPAGKLVLWVYGREGMGFYLAVVGALRTVTTRLPHRALLALCGLLAALLDVYIALCRALPLPLRNYLINTLARVSRDKRKLTIYDQLNPTEARYYRRAEIEALVREAGFVNPQLYHRRGYSWTVLAEKPA